MRLLFALLALVSIIGGCQAQSSATVYVEDSVNTGPWGFFSADHFVGIKLDGSGSSVVHFVGGDNASWQYRCSYSDEWQDAVITPTTQQHVYITQTGTYWVYLAEDGSTNNYDWLEIRVVANSFSGSITPLYGSAPSGWQFGYPPFGVHMNVQGASPPASQAGHTTSTSIKSWLIPLLVVIIVAAIAIPSTIYLVRRHQAKKLAMLGSQVEQRQGHVQDINMEQMNQAVRV